MERWGHADINNYRQATFPTFGNEQLKATYLVSVFNAWETSASWQVFSLKSLFIYSITQRMQW